MKATAQLLATVLATVASMASLACAQTDTSSVSTATATVTSTASSSLSSSSALANTFEVDVVYPRNETYNMTDTLPVVFAIQNPTASARLLGDFTFRWTLMPYSKGGSQASGLTVTSSSPFRLSTANFTGDTYFIVDVTNPLKFEDYFKEVAYGTWVYALDFFIHWNDVDKVCRDISGSSPPSQHGRIFLSIGKDEERNPDVRDLEDGQCPLRGAVIRVDHEVFNKDACPGTTALTDDGDPCAVKVDAARVSSMSSEVQSLATPPPKPTETASDDDSLASGLGVPAWLLQGVALCCLSILCL